MPGKIKHFIFIFFRFIVKIHRNIGHLTLTTEISIGTLKEEEEELKTTRNTEKL